MRNPLLLAGPGVPEGEERSDLVELIDLFATMVELAEAEPRHTHFGRSLLTGEPRTRPSPRAASPLPRSRCSSGPTTPTTSRPAQHEAPETVGKAIALRTERWTYVYRLYEGDELYDRASTPASCATLSGSPETAPIEREPGTASCAGPSRRPVAVPRDGDPRQPGLADYRPATAADTAAIACPCGPRAGGCTIGVLPRRLPRRRRGYRAAGRGTERLARPAPEDRTTVAVDGEGEIVGLAHTILHDDPEWGALLDNLHVRPDLKRWASAPACWRARRPRSSPASRSPASTSGCWSRTHRPGVLHGPGGAERGPSGSTPPAAGAIGTRAVWPDPGLLLSAPDLQLWVRSGPFGPAPAMALVGGR